MQDSLLLLSCIPNLMKSTSFCLFLLSLLERSLYQLPPSSLICHEKEVTILPLFLGRLGHSGQRPVVGRRLIRPLVVAVGVDVVLVEEDEDGTATRLHWGHMVRVVGGLVLV